MEHLYKDLVPPNEDPYPLLDAIQKTVAEATEANVQAAGIEWQNSASRYKAPFRRRSRRSISGGLP